MNSYAITVEELERHHEVVDAVSKSRQWLLPLSSLADQN
jgi:hypothetical protein